MSKKLVRKTLVQNLVAYAIAAVIVWYAARGVSWNEVAGIGSHATIWMFVIASLGGFLCWFVGETVLYSRLFSYFHGSTGERELLPTMAAVYFLQIVNSYVASGALVLFLHARKRAPWLMGGCTLMFQGYLDAMLLAALSLLRNRFSCRPHRFVWVAITRQVCWVRAVSSRRFGFYGENGFLPAIGSDGSTDGRRWRVSA